MLPTGSGAAAPSGALAHLIGAAAPSDGPAAGAARGSNVSLPWLLPRVMRRDRRLLETLGLCEAWPCTYRRPEAKHEIPSAGQHGTATRQAPHRPHRPDRPD